MTELDDAMKEHMAYLVLVERRSFSYKDFLSLKLMEKPIRCHMELFVTKYQR